MIIEKIKEKCGLESINIETYFIEQYINSFKNLEIIPVDYMEIKQIWENEGEELKGVETLKRISKLSGKKLLVEGFPQPWLLHGELSAVEDLSEYVSGCNLKEGSNKIAEYMKTEVPMQTSLADF